MFEQFEQGIGMRDRPRRKFIQKEPLKGFVSEKMRTAQNARVKLPERTQLSCNKVRAHYTTRSFDNNRGETYRC